MEIVAAYRDMRAAIEAAANMASPASVYDTDQILHPEPGDHATAAADRMEFSGARFRTQTWADADGIEVALERGLF